MTMLVTLRKVEFELGEKQGVSYWHFDFEAGHALTHALFSVSIATKTNGNLPRAEEEARDKVSGLINSLAAGSAKPPA